MGHGFHSFLYVYQRVTTLSGFPPTFVTVSLSTNPHQVPSTNDLSVMAKVCRLPAATSTQRDTRIAFTCGVFRELLLLG